jgi:hypothetical protein
MSTGAPAAAAKSDADLYKVLGEGNTSELYARPVRIVTLFDVPYGGGSSVDGKEVYIDRDLHEWIKSGRLAVKGMTAGQLEQAIVEHEHTEWAVDVGDNPVDRYDAAHEFATAKEHRFVFQLRVDPEFYEKCIRGSLDKIVKKAVRHPPPGLWCGPYLDKPTPRDKEILSAFRRLGVDDAHKESKIDVHYGIGPNECRTCVMWGNYRGDKGDLRHCDLVSGLTRIDRTCDRHQERNGK